MRVIFFYILCSFLISCSQQTPTQSVFSNNTKRLFNITEDSIDYFDKEGVKIYSLENKPIENFTISSTTHLGYISEIAKYDSAIYSKLVGTTLDVLKFASNEEFLKRVEQNKIKNIGTDANLDYEFLSKVSAHFSVPYFFEGLSNTINQTNCINFPIYEWMESSPLARAEWVKVFASVASKKEIGDSIYNDIERRYEREIVDCQNDKQVSIIVGEPYLGTWYTPYRDSYIGRLISDAGCKLVTKDKDFEVGVCMPVDIEEAIFLFSEADVWINVSRSTIEELLTAHPYCKNFKSVKNGMVFNNMGRVKDEVRNDYWESAVVNPDKILRDIKFSVKNQVDSLIYFKKLY